MLDIHMIDTAASDTRWLPDEAPDCGILRSCPSCYAERDPIPMSAFGGKADICTGKVSKVDV